MASPCRRSIDAVVFQQKLVEARPPPRRPSTGGSSRVDRPVPRNPTANSSTPELPPLRRAPAAALSKDHPFSRTLHSPQRTGVASHTAEPSTPQGSPGVESERSTTSTPRKPSPVRRSLERDTEQGRDAQKDGRSSRRVVSENPQCQSTISISVHTRRRSLASTNELQQLSAEGPKVEPVESIGERTAAPTAIPRRAADDRTNRSADYATRADQPRPSTGTGTQKYSTPRSSRVAGSSSRPRTAGSLSARGGPANTTQAPPAASHHSTSQRVHPMQGGVASLAATDVTTPMRGGQIQHLQISDLAIQEHSASVIARLGQAVQYDLQDPVKVLERVQELEAQLSREHAAREALQRQQMRARLTAPAEGPSSRGQGELAAGGMHFGRTAAQLGRRVESGVSEQLEARMNLVPKGGETTMETTVAWEASQKELTKIQSPGGDAERDDSVMIKSLAYSRYTPERGPSSSDGSKHRSSWGSPQASPEEKLPEHRRDGVHEGSLGQGSLQEALARELELRDGQWCAEIDKILHKTRSEREEASRQITRLQRQVEELMRRGAEANSTIDAVSNNSAAVKPEVGAQLGAGKVSPDSKDANSNESMMKGGEPDTVSPVATGLSDAEAVAMRSRCAELEGLLAELRQAVEARDAQLQSTSATQDASMQALHDAELALKEAEDRMAAYQAENDLLQKKAAAAEEERDLANGKLDKLASGGMMPGEVMAALKGEISVHVSEIAALKDAQSLLSVKLKEQQDATSSVHQELASALANEDLLKLRIRALEASEKELSDRVDLLTAGLREAQEERETWRRQYLGALDAASAKEAESRHKTEAMEDQVQRAGAEVETLKREMAAVESKLEWEQQRGKELRQDLDAKEAECIELKRTLHEKTREVSRKEAELTAASMEWQESKTALAQLRVQIEGLHRALEQKEAVELKLHGEMEELRASLREAKDEAGIAQSHYRRLEEVSRKGEKVTASLRFEVSRLTGEGQALREEVNGLTQRNAALEQSCASALKNARAKEEALQAMAEEKVMLEQSLTELRLKYGADEGPEELGGWGVYQ